MKHYWILASVIIIALGLSTTLLPRDDELRVIHAKGGQFERAVQEFEIDAAKGSLEVSVVVPLTELYVHLGEIDKAVSLMQRFVDKNPDNISARKILGKMYQDAMMPDEYQASQEEINRRQGSEGQLRRLAFLYETKGQYKKKIAALEVLVSRYPGQAGDYLELSYHHAAKGSPAKALGILEQMQEKLPGPVPLEIEEMWISLLLETGQNKQAKARALNRLLDEFDESAMGRFLDIFQEKNQQGTVLQLVNVFESKIEESPELQYRLIELMIDHGEPHEAIAQFKKLKESGDLSGPAAAEFIERALNAKQHSLAVRLARNTKGQTIPDEFLVRLAEKGLQANQPELLREILKNNGDGFLSNRPVLASHLMLKLNEKKAAAHWIQRSAKLEPLDEENQIDLANLYSEFDTRELAKGLPDKETLRKDLIEKLPDPEIRKGKLIQALVNLKSYEPVLPHLKKIAAQKDGIWAATYEDVLKKLERKEDMIEAWRSRVKRQDLSSVEKRRLAVLLLEANQLPDAEKAFLGLAKSAPPESPDVYQLLSLWEPRPQKSALDWLVSRARSSKGGERAGWLNHMIQANAADQVVAFIDDKIPNDPKVFETYLEALTVVGDGPRVATAVRHQLPLEKNPERLKHFGKLTKGLGQLEVAKAVYKKLLQSHPQDPSSLLQLGDIAYRQNRWEEVREYLGIYLNRHESDWKMDYQYSEANEFLGNRFEAQKYCLRTLKKTENSTENLVEMQLARGYCLDRLNRTKEAIALFENILEAHPEDPKARSSANTALMKLNPNN